MDVDAERRKLWRAHVKAAARAYAAREVEADALAEAGDAGQPTTPIPPFPDELRGLRCGARTRRGSPCRRCDLHASGRCKLHGGASTGAKTAEGQARARLNLAKRWDPVGGQLLVRLETVARAAAGTSPPPPVSGFAQPYSRRRSGLV
jgi:hypothetical protein